MRKAELARFERSIGGAILEMLPWFRVLASECCVAEDVEHHERARTEIARIIGDILSRSSSRLEGDGTNVIQLGT